MSINGRALVGATLLLVTTTVAGDGAAPVVAATPAFVPVPAVTPDRMPPNVRLTAPSAGAAIARRVQVTAAATDNRGVVGASLTSGTAWVMQAATFRAASP